MFPYCQLMRTSSLGRPLSAMKAMRFFFYGTLLAGSSSPIALDVHRKLRKLGPARVRGRLYAVPDPEGWYPALTPGPSVVRGELYEAAGKFHRSDLAALDAYEDFNPAGPRGSLYLRKKVTAFADDGRSVIANAYVFNHTLPAAARPIRHGDFPVWLMATGFPAFGSSHRSGRGYCRAKGQV